MWVLEPCLIIPSKKNHVDVNIMLAILLWSYTRSLLCVYMLCFLCKHLSHSHTKSYTLSRKLHHGQPMINHKCRACFSHHRSVMLIICVRMVWVISSSSHVGVSLQDHVCTFSLFHTLSHFPEVMMTKFPSDIQAFTLPSIWSTITQNRVEAPSNPFQAALLASRPIILHDGQPESLTWQSPHD